MPTLYIGISDLVHVLYTKAHKKDSLMICRSWSTCARTLTLHGVSTLSAPLPGMRGSITRAFFFNII